MISRCYVKRDYAYAYYGGRGIYVCDEWRSSPYVFDAWCRSQPGYGPGMTIDRIDPDGPYWPGNCRFVTPRENALHMHASTRPGKFDRRRESYEDGAVFRWKSNGLFAGYRCR